MSKERSGENKRVLYIGGFELPDRNAAAHRVVANAKIFSDLGYEVILRGITKSDDYCGTVEGFRYESVKYPDTIKEWCNHLTGINCKEIIAEWQPSIVVVYNYPAVALERLKRFCKQKKITVIGDVTEWYSGRGNPLKWADTSFRMRYVHKHLDGLIVISRYLNDYYKGCKTVLLPPLVDLAEDKWQSEGPAVDHDKIKLVYIGILQARYSLDVILDTISHLERRSRIELSVVRLTKEDCRSLFQKEECKYDFVTFKGMLTHKETIRLLKSSDFQIFMRENNRVNNAGFSTKLVETISCGIPVITNLTSNIGDYVKEGKNGFFIDDTTPDSQIETMSTSISATREQIEQMKQYCRENQLFDYHNYVIAFGQFLQTVLPMSKSGE